MRLSEFHEDHAGAVVALWQKCGLTRPWNDPYRDIARKQTDKNGRFLVGHEAGSLIATIMVGYDGHRGSVNYIGVNPDVQQSGVGRVIMQRIEADLIAAGCPKLNLQVRSDNENVLAFYNRLDYQRDAKLSLSKRLISDN